MKTLIGILIILAGVALSLYLGVYLCLIGGIVQVVHSATPTVNAGGIAWGVLRILCTGLVGGCTFWIFLDLHNCWCNRRQSLLGEPMKILYEINNPGDSGAGIFPYYEEVTVEVQSGDPGGDPGEFEDYIKQSLREWFDGSRIISYRVTDET